MFPPVGAGVLGVRGAVALAKFAAREWRRINAALHPDPTTGDDRPRLRTVGLHQHGVAVACLGVGRRRRRIARHHRTHGRPHI